MKNIYQEILHTITYNEKYNTLYAYGMIHDNNMCNTNFICSTKKRWIDQKH